MATILLTVDVDDESDDIDALTTALEEAGFREMETARTYALRFPPEIEDDDLYERVALQGPEWYVRTAVEQGADDLGARVVASYLISSKSGSEGRPTSFTADGSG